MEAKGEEGMDKFLQTIGQTSPGIHTAAAVLVVVFSLLTCFLGYRLLKLWISIIGFAIGALAGYLIAGCFTETTWILVVAALGLGVILGAISFRIYLVGVFLYATLCGYIFMQQIIGDKDWWAIAVCVIAGIGIGLLAINFVRPVMRVSTSVSGGMSASVYGLALFSVTTEIVVYIVAAVLAIAGMIVQFRQGK